MNVDASITELLLEGRASSAHEAEEIFLNENLKEVVALAKSPLSEEEFRDHPLIQLLMSHGSRPSEDSLK